MTGERLTVEADTPTVDALHTQALSLGVPAADMTREPLPDPMPAWQPGDIVDIERDGGVKRFVVLDRGRAATLGSLRVIDRADAGWPRLWRNGRITIVSRVTG